jgi:hypothetical protein
MNAPNQTIERTTEDQLRFERDMLRIRTRKLEAALATAWSIGSCHKLPEFHVLNQWRELINSQT